MKLSSRPTLYSPLASLLRRKPVVAMPETLLRDAVATMAEEHVGSIVIVEPESRRPLGIFTWHDLITRLAKRPTVMDDMIMSLTDNGSLVVANWRATAYQAAVLMARHNVHHIIVIDASGKLAGVIAQTDIYELQSGGGKAISGVIRDVRDMDGLISGAAEIRRLAIHMLSEGAAAEPMMQLISTLNDHLTSRLIEITRSEFDLPKVRWCWLSFGSEGRYEQTLATDQDNGLAFDMPAEETQSTRKHFLPFARVVNERLAACGFTLCKGNVMASNPELCLSLEEWRSRFREWITVANPLALLNATIYFDFRSIYGDDAVADELRLHLAKTTPDASLFLRGMAANAIDIKPPLSWWGGFNLERDSNFPATIDLKTQGARLYVDAARILALAHGIAATSTAERLRALKAMGHLQGDDLGAIIESFFFIQRLRIRLQQSGSAEGMANRLNPAMLNAFDRQTLKTALGQARRLQSRLQADYRL